MSGTRLHHSDDVRHICTTPHRAGRLKGPASLLVAECRALAVSACLDQRGLNASLTDMGAGGLGEGDSDVVVLEQGALGDRWGAHVEGKEGWEVGLRDGRWARRQP